MPLFYLLAESERQLKNAEGAAAAARRLREAFPDDRRGPPMEAQLHEDAGRLAEAEKTLRDLIAKDPLDSAALNFLGHMLADRNDRVPRRLSSCSAPYGWSRGIRPISIASVGPI